VNVGEREPRPLAHTHKVHPQPLEANKTDAADRPAVKLHEAVTEALE